MTAIDTASNVARKSALAYVGALALTGDAARDSFERLSKRGADAQRLMREQAQKLANRLRRQADAPAEAKPAEAHKARTLLSQGRDRLFDRLQIPTQASLAELNSEIERLSAAIDDLRVKSRRQPVALAPTPEPLPGYEKMNVDTVLSRLPKLDEAGLLAVQAYEQAHQGRVTVLRGVERTLAERQTALVEA